MRWPISGSFKSSRPAFQVVFERAQAGHMVSVAICGDILRKTAGVWRFTRRQTIDPNAQAGLANG